ncbi:MAG TPA: SDR family NAD(P)-dependent oxidoreductase [Bryobacteraceae bacterium]|nr:SDR family NAD(P)-dependent oxidoreductase [Bryobacteraceae bacterium]
MPERSRAVLVTGASRGLGRAIALHAASAGFRVWAGIRDQAAASEMISTAQSSGFDLRPVTLDVTDRKSIQEACCEIAGTDGTLYGVVNNAGVTGRSFFEDYPEEHVRKVFEVNLFGPMNVIRCALPLLRANGGGRIVNIGSIGGRIGSNSVAPYAASKFALEGFSESLGIELRPFGIYVTAIAPGVIRTDIWDEESRILPGARNPRSPYYQYFWRMERQVERLVSSSTLTPADVARQVVHVLQTPRPRTRYVVGGRAALVVFLRKHLPDRVFESLYFGAIQRIMKRNLEADGNLPVRQER